MAHTRRWKRKASVNSNWPRVAKEACPSSLLQGLMQTRDVRECGRSFWQRRSGGKTVKGGTTEICSGSQISALKRNKTAAVAQLTVEREKWDWSLKQKISRQFLNRERTLSPADPGEEQIVILWWLESKIRIIIVYKHIGHSVFPFSVLYNRKDRT